ncbi:MAG: hypothetical protein AAF639_41730 [Chloroflexota bacterium]
MLSIWSISGASYSSLSPCFNRHTRRVSLCSELRHGPLFTALRFHHLYSSPGFFNNNGTYTKSGSLMTSIFNTVSNTGAINVQAGTLRLREAWTNSGTIDISSGAIVDVDGDFENQADGQFTGAGTLDVSHGDFMNNGTVTDSVTFIP